MFSARFCAVTTISSSLATPSPEEFWAGLCACAAVRNDRRVQTGIATRTPRVAGSQCATSPLPGKLPHATTPSRRAMSPEYDFVVIGGGMIGSAIAAHLAEHASVRLLEMEDQPGYHSTGRSAAIFSEAYGNDLVRAITRASREFFYSPPPNFTSIALVRPRQVLITAHGGQEGALEKFMESTASAGDVQRQSVAEAVGLCPVLRPSELVGAALSRNPADIEVHELQHGYLRWLKARGGVVSTGTRVMEIDNHVGGWTVVTTQGAIRARTIVNAAGAWAGEIARLAGAQHVGLRPLRRTACLIESPAGVPVDTWPMLLNVEEEFYLKPDAGLLLLSPADETDTAPCDAQADELDIAIAVDRLERATTLEVRRIAHRWAGLRSFVEDRSPVLGYDEQQPGFFWLAALGGYGIQTAPALSRIAASLALRRPIDASLLDFGIDPMQMSPARIREALA
ncbi:MAG: FAD-binding oxidoreductase [Gammaproteobacteria bacterium]